MASIPLPALSIRPPEAPENPIEQYGHLLQLKGAMGQQQMQQQQIQAGSQENQIRQQQIKDQQATTAAMQQWDGKDLNALPSLVLKNGASAQAVIGLKNNIIKQQQDLANLSKDQLANEKTKNDYFAQGIDNVKSLPPDQQPAAFEATKADAVQKGHLDPQQAQNMQYPGPQGLDILEKTLMGHSAVVEQALKNSQQQEAQNKADLDRAQLPGAQAEADQKVRSNAATQLAGAASQQQYAEMWGELPAKIAKGFPAPEQWTPEAKQQILQTGMTPHEQVSVPVANIEMKDWLAKNPGKGPSDYEVAMKKVVPAFNFNLTNAGPVNGANGAPDWNATAKKYGYSPQAFDAIAEKFYQTGQLPAVGRGGPAMAANKAIMNRAVDLHPNDSLAGNSAAFKANEDSLKSLQKNFDQVTAFENTAGKNLDTFLKTAANVHDWGSPIFNTPVRLVSDKLAGSENQAAFNAARTTALTEISKVLNSSNASGVLSDSARNEVSQLVGPNATLGQIKKAAEILRNDMANRHQSYQDQIANIQGRLNGKSGEASKTMVTMRAPNGQTKQVSPDQVDHYKQMGATVIQ